jgi:proliferating cell nuclear antigen
METGISNVEGQSHVSASSTMAMTCTTIQSSAIRQLFEVLKDVLFDVSLEFTPKGWRLLTMDGSRCALVFMKLDAEAFEAYSCIGTYNVGINIASFHKLLRIAGNNDTITLFLENSNTVEIGLKISNVERNSVTVFKYKCLDVDSENIEIPDVSFDSVMVLQSSYWQRILRDMSVISNAVTICSQGDQLTLTADGDFAHQHTVLGPAETGLQTEAASSSGKFEAKFSLKYLTLFAKAAALCPTVEIFMRTNFPLITQFRVSNLGVIKFCLAPKAD